MPFPYWLGRAQASLGVEPTGYAAPEAYAIAHALQTLVAGFLAGHTGSQCWRHNWLGDKEGGDNPVRAYYGRLEYQDGG
eukprot:6392676-Pyramimonas_sp.AAC.1